MKCIQNIMMAALLSGSVAFSSCDDWLALDPENAVPADQYWQTKEDVAAAMTGIYCSLVNVSSFMLEQGEMRADFMVLGPQIISVNYQNIREGNITSSNPYVQWQRYYTVINNCNLLLERADMALENDGSFTVAECEKYKSQAKVVRALMYFYLIRLYKDVPYVTWAYYDDQVERDCPVTNQMDILNDLITQLEEIRTNKTLDYPSLSMSSAQNKGVVTMYALDALLADMYRWKGSLETDAGASVVAYERCVQLCDEIINSGQYSLLVVPKTDAKEAIGTYLEEAVSHADSCFYVMEDNAVDNMYDQLYVKGNSVESIFELQADDYTAVGSFYSNFCTSSRLYMPNDAHLVDDIFLPTTNVCAPRNYEDIRYKLCSAGPGESKFCWKYAGSDLNGNSIVSALEYKKNVLVYRLAEIYLMKAEALNQVAWANGEDQQRLVEAYKAVFKVRDRACAVEATDVLAGSQPMQVRFWDELRNDSTITLADGVSLSCKEMEQFILDEEAREMAFEGRRWFDVLRHAARNNYDTGTAKGGGLNYLLNIVLYSTSVDKINYLRNAYQNYESHYLPYPKQDVSLNKYLTQKPFYGTE